jgi:hypothetical protein
MADPLFVPQADHLQIVSRYPGFLHSRKLDHLNSSDSDVGWFNKTGRLSPNEGSLLQPLQKRKHIGFKNQRVLMDSEDALELKLTWEEAQDLLRPPPTVKPNVVLMEDYEFEEYDVSGFPPSLFFLFKRSDMDFFLFGIFFGVKITK